MLLVFHCFFKLYEPQYWCLFCIALSCASLPVDQLNHLQLIPLNDPQVFKGERITIRCNGRMEFLIHKKHKVLYLDKIVDFLVQGVPVKPNLWQLLRDVLDFITTMHFSHYSKISSYSFGLLFSSFVNCVK